MAQLVYRSQAQSVGRVLENINGTAAHLKHLWENIHRPQFTTADQSADVVAALFDQMKAALAVYDNALTRPGLTEAGQAERNDPNYDVVAEATATRDELVVVGAWMITAWNANSADYRTLSQSGEWIIKTFTVAQLAGLVTRMDALTAKIGFVDA